MGGNECEVECVWTYKPALTEPRSSSLVKQTCCWKYTLTVMRRHWGCKCFQASALLRSSCSIWRTQQQIIYPNTHVTNAAWKPLGLDAYVFSGSTNLNIMLHICQVSSCVISWHDLEKRPRCSTMKWQIAQIRMKMRKTGRVQTQ